VQFGEQHAAEHGHAATGKTFKPLLQRWDSDHPIHLIGKKLHYLVAQIIAIMRSYLICVLPPCRSFIRRADLPCAAALADNRAV
jgi:hypothetical protein